MATAVPKKNRTQSEIREVSYHAQQFKELTIAHNSSILVYNKTGENNTKELVRKYRPEFEEIYVFNDAKSCFSFIDVHNYDMEHQKISLILLEADIVSIKILDYLSKRALVPETSSFPLIAAVVLLPPNVETEMMQNIETAGGASALIQLPSSSADIFSSLIDVLYRRRVVETMYNDLKVINQESRYPFLPTFIDAKPTVDHNSLSNVKRGDTDVNQGDRGHDGEDNNDENNMNYIVTKNNDDWTECSSMLPKYVKSFRSRERRKKGMPDTLKSIKGHVKMTAGEKLETEYSQRVALDSTILSKLKAATSTMDVSEESVDMTKLFDGEFIDEMDSEASSDLSDDDKGDDSSDDDDESDELVDDDVYQVNDDYGVGSVAKGENLRQLLDSSKRPKWGYGYTSKSPANTMIVSSTANPSAAAFLDMEMRPFVERSAPDLGNRRTVGGLSKEVADSCWKVLKAHGVIEVDTSITARRPAAADLLQMARNPPITKEKQPKPPVGSIQNLHDYEDVGDFVLGTSRSSATNTTSSTIGDPTSPHKHHHIDRMQIHHKPTISLPATMKRSQRKLKNIVKNTPPDVFVHNLLDVELHNRKINMGDRDLLERGLRHEMNNDVDQAIVCYVRARKQSKDTQLPLMFLGAVHFKRGQYLVALKHYNAAMRIIAEARGAMYVVQDDFVTSFNRGITYFRLGDDAGGLADLLRAVGLRPNHVTAKELLSLVQRRMGNFDEAINTAMETKKIRIAQRALDVEKRMEEVESKASSKRSTSNPSVSIKSSKKFVNDEYSGMPVYEAAEAEAEAHAVKLLLPSQGERITNLKTNFLPQISDSGRPLSRDSRTPPDGKDRDDDRIVSSTMGSPSSGYATYTRRRLKIPVAHEEWTIKELENMSLKARTDRALSVFVAEKGGFDALNSFKATNGYKANLFESFFIKPNTLQEAFGCRPKLRSKEQLDLITSTLRLFPVLRKMSDAVISEFAHVVEYRTVSNLSQLFTQNNAADAAVLLLKGCIEMRMEKPANTPLEDVVVGHIYELGVMGHIDYLFRDENNSFFQDLKEMCYMEHNPGFQDIPGTPVYIEKMDITELHTKAAAFLDRSEKSCNSDEDNFSGKLLEAGKLLDGTDSKKNVKEGAGNASPHSNTLLHMGLTRHARRASIETSALDELDNAGAWRRTSAMSVIPKGEDPSGGDIAIPIHIHGHDPLSRSGHDLMARVIHEQQSQSQPQSQSQSPSRKASNAPPLHGTSTPPSSNVTSSKGHLSARRNSITSVASVDSVKQSHHTSSHHTPSHHSPSHHHTSDHHDPSRAGMAQSMYGNMARVTQLTHGTQVTPSVPRQGPMLTHRSDLYEGLDATSAVDAITMKVIAAAQRRALAPEMFLSYTMTTPCEMLVVGDEQFERFLRPIAVEEFTKSLHALNACGVFDSWSVEDRIRLARMGHVRTYKSGELMMKQGEKPNHFCVILRGMSRAYKQPKEKEIFMTKLAALKQKALQFDTKYVYHHKLRNTLRQIPEDEKMKEMHAIPVAHPIPTSPHQSLPSSPTGKHPTPNPLSSTTVSPVNNNNSNNNNNNNNTSSTSPGKLNSHTSAGPSVASPKSRRVSSMSVASNESNSIMSLNIHRNSTSPMSPSLLSIRRPSSLSPLSLSNTHRSRKTSFIEPMSPSTSFRSPKFTQKSFNANLDTRYGAMTRTILAKSMFAEYEHLTAAESERRDLAIEIAHYENLIDKASHAEAREQADRENDFLSMVHGNNPSGDHPSGGKESYATKPSRLFYDTSKLCEIATLQWPMIYGEACVSDPEEGLSRGTIVADTTTDVFIMHKKQIQTFYMDPRVIDKVQQKAVAYPDDTELVAKNRSKEGWLKIREALMADIPKTRWPTKGGEENEPFVF